MCGPPRERTDTDKLPFYAPGPSGSTPPKSRGAHPRKWSTYVNVQTTPVESGSNGPITPPPVHKSSATFAVGASPGSGVATGEWVADSASHPPTHPPTLSRGITAEQRGRLAVEIPYKPHSALRFTIRCVPATAFTLPVLPSDIFPSALLRRIITQPYVLGNQERRTGPGTVCSRTNVRDKTLSVRKPHRPYMLTLFNCTVGDTL